MVALAWGVSPLHAVALQSCHRRYPLRLGRLAADYDCLAHGVRTGIACIGTCWAVMAATLLAPHHHAAMAVTGVLLLLERVRVIRMPILGAGRVSGSIAANRKGDESLILG